MCSRWYSCSSIIFLSVPHNVELDLPSPRPQCRLLSFLPAVPRSSWMGLQQEEGGALLSRAGRVPVIQSTERGGWRKKTDWVGRSLFLARRKTERRSNRRDSKTSTFATRVSSAHVLLLCKESFVAAFKRDKRAFRVDFLALRERRWDRHYSSAAVARQWAMNEIVFGNVLRAEHWAKGTGGALDQSTPAMRREMLLTFPKSSHLPERLANQHILCLIGLGEHGRGYANLTSSARLLVSLCCCVRFS